MSTSHAQPISPSPLLVLVCLSIVRRLRPQWVAVRLEDAARSVEVSPERLSRLTTRAVGVFEGALAPLTRRGRPPKDARLRRETTELALTQALLEVSTAILSRIHLRRRVVGDYIVGAWQRLSAEHGVTQARFCAALGLSPRTFRSWLSSPPASRPRPQESPVERPRPPRRRSRPGRRRFGFDVLLPDTQLAADTTGISAFGVPLKLVAAQDVGGRDQDLLDSVIVDVRECADHVISVLRASLDGAPGAQVITDQGTPYMAQATVRATEMLEAEHAPQREADPLGKATIERAFGTVKSIARPLLPLTDRIASDWPPPMPAHPAMPFARLVIAAPLPAYPAGPPATRTALEARGSVDPATPAKLAEESRERARALESSARLRLAHIHEIYEIGGSRRAFVDCFRHYPMPVLESAERAFRSQVGRDDIKNRAAYFGAIVRAHHDELRALRARQAHEASEDERRARQDAEHRHRDQAHRQDPAGLLHQALQLLSKQWDARKGELRLDGRGLPRGWILKALTLLREHHRHDAASDIALGVLHRFELGSPAELPAIHAVRSVLEELLEAPHPEHHDHSADPPQAAAILCNTSREQRPPPPARLWINVARLVAP